MKTDHDHRLECVAVLLACAHVAEESLVAPQTILTLLILHFYIVVSEYGKDSADAEIVLLKRKGKIDVRSTSVADFIRENILKQKSYYQLVSCSISVNKKGLTLRARCQPLFYWFVAFLFGEEGCLYSLREGRLRPKPPSNAVVYLRPDKRFDVLYSSVAE